MSVIEGRIARIRERIAAAAESAARNPAEITLIAVTKTIDLGRIREAVEAGIQDLGENYVQEARAKNPALDREIRWHFIGHLQSNKARYIPGAFHLVHSVDSVSLSRELDKRAAAKDILQNLLIEVKLDPSATKNGIEPANLPALVDSVLSCPNLRLRGLMGMAPVVARSEEARPYFARLRELAASLPVENAGILSMGMTADFEAAVREGSTMVRIGAAIFGPRQ